MFEYLELFTLTLCSDFMTPHFPDEENINMFLKNIFFVIIINPS